MAIQKTFYDPLTEVLKEDAYYRIYNVEIVNGESILINLKAYGSHDLCDHGEGKHINSIKRYMISKDDPLYPFAFENSTVKNAYIYLLSLPEFEGATSVLEEGQ